MINGLPKQNNCDLHLFDFPFIYYRGGPSLVWSPLVPMPLVRIPLVRTSGGLRSQILTSRFDSKTIVKKINFVLDEHYSECSNMKRIRAG